MRPTTIMLLQSLLVSAQVINTGLAALHVSPVFCLIFAGLVAGFQLFVQKIGNDTVPPPKPAERPLVK